MVTNEVAWIGESLAALGSRELVELTGEPLGLKRDAAQLRLGGPQTLTPLRTLPLELLEPGLLAFDRLGRPAFANLDRPQLAFDPGRLGRLRVRLGRRAR